MQVSFGMGRRHGHRDGTGGDTHIWTGTMRGSVPF
jgi:hypothetical protein